MRVLLVGAEVEENLATRYLASALERAGHTTQIVGFARPEHTEQVLQCLQVFRPDLVGLSMTFQRRGHEFGALATALRQAGYQGHLTCGGHFPTFAWRAILERYPAIDSVVRHEGERTLVELCGALEAKAPLANILGVVWRADDGALRDNPPRPLEADLDSLPFPKRVGDPPVHLDIPAAFLVGSRGCYGHCAFCSIHALTAGAGGPMYRARSVENIVDEMAELYRSRGARMFVFHDDDFFTRDHLRDLARVTALRDELRRRSLRDVALVVKARPDDVDPEVFRVLREIGLLRVYVGVETGSSQGLKTLGRGVDLETNRRGLGLVTQMGVYTCFNMLLFDPDSTAASLRESLGFLHEHASVPMNFCRTEIYVGTPLMHRLAREGRLRGDEFGWDYDLPEPAAQRAFQLFADAFLDRNFRPDGLMNSNLSLGYHIHLLRHFFPLAFTPQLEGRARSAITRVNLDCVARMERILDFAASPAAENAEAFAEFAARTFSEVARADEELGEEVAEAIAAIQQAARSRRARPSRWKQKLAAAASLALGPFAYASGADRPMPPDPPPPPHTKPKDAGLPSVQPTGDEPREGYGCPNEDPPPRPHREPRPVRSPDAGGTSLDSPRELPQSGYRDPSADRDRPRPRRPGPDAGVRPVCPEDPPPRPHLDPDPRPLPPPDPPPPPHREDDRTPKKR